MMNYKKVNDFKGFHESESYHNLFVPDINFDNIDSIITISKWDVIKIGIIGANLMKAKLKKNIKILSIMKIFMYLKEIKVCFYYNFYKIYK